MAPRLHTTNPPSGAPTTVLPQPKLSPPSAVYITSPGPALSARVTTAVPLSTTTPLPRPSAMPTLLEGAVPPPHLHLTSNKTWPPYSSPLGFPAAPTSSPLPMSPESLHSYGPHLHDSPLPSQDLTPLPTSAWFGPSLTAPEHTEPAYSHFPYSNAYVTPHTSSVTYSPPAQFAKAELPTSAATDTSLAAYSPVSDYSHLSDNGQTEFASADAPRLSTESAQLQLEASHPARPRSSPSAFAPNQPSAAPLDYSWTMNPLGISTPDMHEQYYSSAAFPSLRARSPRLSEPAMELPHDLNTPQPRRMYAPIAPHPMAAHITSMPKRAREDDEVSEQSKRRKRSDSNTTMTTMELGEEDKLLIKLKDEDSMPWKDIAARFQSDLGKTYQIPALQMRLKRLRERMRVWTDNDVRALRMAHEFWVQNKFDIISQKMLEFGAGEKWTARQCARKWAEIDPGPTPYSAYDHHATPTFTPYAMSPADPPPPPFMPYMHIP